MSSTRPKKIPFKSQYNQTAREQESKRVQARYPDRIPVVCERASSDRLLQDIDKVKYLVPSDLTMGQFTYVVRKRIKLSPEHAIFLMVDGCMLPTSLSMTSVYDKYKDKDGFLYVSYCGENTFG